MEGRGALTGAAIGGLGLGLIAMTGANSCSDDEWGCIETSTGELFLAGTAIGALSGAFVGLIVSGFTEKTTWNNVPLVIEPASVSAGWQKAPNTPGIRFRWNF